LEQLLTEARSTNPFPNLEGYKNANLAMFRKSGEPVVTPVWYAVLDGKLYVRTGAGSGKVKRVRNATLVYGSRPPR
jgi:PPOX class probable F420-dependent enzyme